MTKTDEFKEYVCHYRFQNAEWGITVRARSFSEAEERLKAMSWGRVDGELMAVVPAVAPSWLVSAVCRVRNWMAKAS